MAKKNNNYAYHPTGGAGSAPDADVVDPKSADGGGDGCCSIPCLKFSLHLFNVLFFLSGIVLVAVGVNTVAEKHPSLYLLNSGLYDLTGYIFVAAGCIILVTSVFGCVGICRSSYTQVTWYAVLLAVIFVVEVGAGVLAYFYRGRVQSELERSLSDMIGTEYGVNNKTTEAIDHLQISLACCGVNSFEDWRDSAWMSTPERRNNKVPDSCCITPGRYCGVRDHPSNVRYTGCIHRIELIAAAGLLVVGAVAVGICLVQLVGFVMACFLRFKLKRLTYYG